MKNKKNIILAVIFIIVLVGLAVFGFYASQGQGNLLRFRQLQPEKTTTNLDVNRDLDKTDPVEEFCLRFPCHERCGGSGCGPSDLNPDLYLQKLNRNLDIRTSPTKVKY